MKKNKIYFILIAAIILLGFSPLSISASEINISPDLIFSGFGLSDPDSNNDNTVLLVPSIQNIGTTSFSGIFSIQVEISLNNDLVATEIFDVNDGFGINAGNFTTYTTNYNFTEPGTYSITLTIKNVAGEINTSNNNITKELVVINRTKPDLIPIKLEIRNLTHPSNDIWLQYDILEMVATFKNNGTVDTGPFYFTIMEKNSTSGLRSNILNLKPGESYEFRTQPAHDRDTLIQQDLIYTLRIDSDNNVIESNENNNILTKTLTIGAPKPLIKDTSISIGFESASLAWFANGQYNCSVVYSKNSDLSNGTSLLYTNRSLSGETGYYLYSANLNGLLPSTKYYYKIICTASENNYSESSVYNFTTTTDGGQYYKADLTVKNFKYTDLRQTNIEPWDIQLEFDLTNIGQVKPNQSFLLTVRNTTLNKEIFNSQFYFDYFEPNNYISHVYVVGNVDVTSKSDNYFVYGNNNIIITVDPLDNVSESNENNNTFATAVNVEVISPSCTTGRTTIINEKPLGGYNFQALGLDISKHPEILKYRIQWFNGAWSQWYVPGQNDVDWKTNLNGTQRRVWSYFDDHNHEYEKCLGNQPQLDITNPLWENSGTNNYYKVDFKLDQNATLHFFDNSTEIPDSSGTYKGTMYLAGTHSYTFTNLSVGTHTLAIKAKNDNGEGYDTLIYIRKSSDVEVLQVGDLFIIENNLNYVYYLASNNKRYVFPYTLGSNYKQDVMNSWQVDATKIKTVSAVVAESYALSGNIVLRPGTSLAKTPQSATVYAVGSKQQLHQISTEQLTKLYGSNWSARLVTVPDSFFVNYLIGTAINNNYPDGTLIKYSSDPDKVYLVYGNYKYPITEVGLWANNLNRSSVVTAPVNIVYTNGGVIDKKYDCLTDSAQLATCQLPSTTNVPSLNVSVTDTAKEIHYLAGEINKLLATIKFDAGSSSEDIKVTKVELTDTLSKVGIQADLSNIILTDVSTQTVLNIPESGTFNNSLYSDLVLVFNNPLIIAKGTIKTLKLTADISASAENNTSHQISIDNDTFVLAFGNSSNNQIKVSGSYPLVGSKVVIGHTGKLVVSTSAATVPSGLYTAGGTNSNFGNFDLKAISENIEVKSLKFKTEGLNGGNLLKVINKITLYDGATKLGEAVPTSTSEVILTIPNGLLITSNSVKTLALKGDTNCIGENCPASSGNGLVLNLAAVDVVAVGKTSGLIYSPTNKEGSFQSNKVYLFKTQPVVSKKSLLTTTINNGTQSLYRFTVAADAKGDVGIYKMMFGILDAKNIVISNLVLKDVAADIEYPLTNNSSVYFNDSYLVIPAGTVKTFELVGTVVKQTNDYYVKVKMIGDSSSTVLEPAPASYINTNISNAFIWSDLSKGVDSALSKTQWVNGKYVLFLDANNDNTQVFGETPVVTPNVVQPVVTKPTETFQDQSTSPTLSGAALITDSDNDGLSDQQEEWYGTDPENSDTDSDTYLDGIEVRNGYSPLYPKPVKISKDKTMIYGKSRLGSLTTEQEAAEELWDALIKLNNNRPIYVSPRYWYKLVNAYVYGGYTPEEIYDTIKKGPGKVHPTIEAQAWRKVEKK